MEIEGLKLRERLDLFLNGLKVVVGEVKPFEVRGLPDNVVKDVSEALDGSDLIIVKEE